MKLKISKIMLESSHIFRAKKDIRYYLNGVCFMPGGKLAATDGHRLVKCKLGFAMQGD